MFPQPVFDLLQFDLQGSADRARKGDVPGGRAMLQAGLDRARQDQVAGEPWAEELIRQYEQALANFEQRYGQAPEPP